MKTFVKDKDYVFMLERGRDDIFKVQKNPLEAELLHLNGIPTGRKSILEYRNDVESQLVNVGSVRASIDHQTIASIIHVGFYEFKSAKGNHVYVTDGIPPGRFLK